MLDFISITKADDFALIELPKRYGSPWDIRQKIQSFANLPSGWHYGAGIASPLSRVELAHDWHERIAALGFIVTDASPGAAGEIMISAEHERHSIEIVLEADDTLSLYYELDDDPVVSLDHKSAAIIDLELERIAGGIWSTFVSFTKEILPPLRIDSIDWRFVITGVALLSFNDIVWKALCAHIRKFYQNAAGEPPIFWIFPEQTIPPRAVFKQERSSLGDDCHHNIYGVEDSEYAEILKSHQRNHGFSDFYICDNGAYRPFKGEDLLPP